MVQLPKINIEPYVDALVRRRWWIVAPVVLALVAGGVYVKITPKTYEASTLILVEPQRIPTTYVQPTVTESVQSRLRTISQQVNSRTNLERIIKDFNLYPESRLRERGLKEVLRDRIAGLLHKPLSQEEIAPKVPMMTLVEDLRKKINVKVRGEGNAFEIGFQWHEAETAAAVANAIASQFIEQNLKVREEMAMGTTAFLDSETQRLRKELEVREQALEKFKKENMGMLPDQLQSNLNILNQMKEELADLEKRVALEKQQALMLQSQSQAMAQSGPDMSSLLGGEETMAGSGEVEQLKTKLADLLTRYTDRHPDVVAVKRQIAKLEEEASKTGPQPSAKPLNVGISGQDMFAVQLEQINGRIADYEKQITLLKEQIALYKERVEKTPQVELELTKLIRDYQTVQDRYAKLLAKKLDAQMAEELERRQKGEQFRVLDPAIPPEKPVKPDMVKVFAVALVLGLGLGAGLAYVRETLDPRFYAQEEVEAVTRCKVLVSLPLMKDPAVKPKKGLKRLWRRAA
uniref:Polysaccharide chain length determinant protein, PEP-CTERM locus subfamily n=1 Tax=Desulfacinum infernum TaxID=35837 RepID=A0A832A6G5_9BACT